MNRQSFRNMTTALLTDIPDDVAHERTVRGSWGNEVLTLMQRPAYINCSGWLAESVEASPSWDKLPF